MPAERSPPGRAWAVGEGVSGPEPPFSEDDEYAPDDYSSLSAARLLRPPRRSFVGPIIVFAGIALPIQA
jgi:hypothetical protein